MPIYIENSFESRSSTINMVRNIYIYIYICVRVCIKVVYNLNTHPHTHTYIWTHPSIDGYPVLWYIRVFTLL